MNPEKALEISDAFRKYCTTWEKEIVKKYTIKELKSAAYYLHKQYGNDKWYEELDKQIKALEYQEKLPEIRRNWVRSYIIDKIVPILISAFFGFVCALILKAVEIEDLKLEIRDLKAQSPKIPVTVVSGQGHKIYIDEPIGHENYYEFPIYLNDGKGSYRIDQYKYLNPYKGFLIIKQKEAVEK